MGREHVGVSKSPSQTAQARKSVRSPLCALRTQFPPNTGRKSCVCVCVCVCVHSISPQHWKEIMCVCVCVCVHARQVPSVVSNSWQPHGLQPTRLLCPGHSPGKNIGVGCHFLLQGIFPTQGLNHTSFSPALAGRFFTMRAIWEARKSDSASN